MRRFSSFLLFYIMINGCAYDRADARSPDAEKPTVIKTQTYAYECPDGFGFVARTEADTVWLFLPGNTIDLPRITSASGVKYSKGGHFFQAEGDRAMIVSSTAKHTGCMNNRAKAIWEHAKLNGVDFRATGNEPGWYLEISNKTDILLVADYGEHTYQFKSATIQSEAQDRTSVYNATNNGDTIEVVITGTPCQDSMSGEKFSAKVSVLVNDRRYDGCGKALH